MLLKPLSAWHFVKAALARAGSPSSQQSVFLDASTLCKRTKPVAHLCHDGWNFPERNKNQGKTTNESIKKVVLTVN